MTLFNLATRAPWSSACSSLYAALFVLALLGALLLVVDPLFTEALGHPAGLADHLELAWLISSLATVGGALGAGLETDEAVREAAYTYRPGGTTARSPTARCPNQPSRTADGVRSRTRTDPPDMRLGWEDVMCASPARDGALTRVRSPDQPAAVVNFQLPRRQRSACPSRNCVALPVSAAIYWVSGARFSDGCSVTTPVVVF